MFPHCDTTEHLAEGRFLRLDLIHWTDATGCARKWEAAQRPGSNLAALVVATLRPSNRVILIRQFRPPVNSFVIEMPAGLVDPGETVEQAAVRELKEETGYEGTVTWQTGPCSSSAGLSGELVSVVFMDIPEDSPANQLHQRNLQEGEDISLKLVSLEELPQVLSAAVQNGDLVDSRLAAWAAAQGVRWKAVVSG